MIVSEVFQSSPGIPLQANWNVPSATAALTLGRPLAGSAPNVVVNLLSPGQMWSPRVNDLDTRIGKVLRFGSKRATISLDLYNVLNISTPLTYNQTYISGGQWLVPTSVLTARTAKFTMQYDF